MAQAHSEQKYLREIWLDNLLTFLHGIHGNNTFEVRFMPEGGFGYSSSILRHGDHLYLDTRNGKKARMGEYKPEVFEDFLTTGRRVSGGGAVWFTVNSPNFETMDSCVTSDKHIIKDGKINSQFVDIDAPKEVRKDWLQLKKWKEGAKGKILSFPLRPSIVIETKHGYHVYWLLRNGEHKLFRHVQTQLIQYFDGDAKCVNESRLLRIPGFMHRKDPKKPYPIQKRVFEPENRYTQEELRKILPELEAETLEKIRRNQENKEERNNISKPPSLEMCSTRRNNIMQLLLEKVNHVKVDETKIRMHCCMPDHLDNNPSAWIDTNYMWFHCSSCLSQYPIDQLAEELGWTDVLEAWNKVDV